MSAQIEEQAVVWPRRQVLRYALAGAGAYLLPACGGASAYELDADGVQMLFPSAPGANFRLGGADPNGFARLVIEKRSTAIAGTEGGLSFWNLPSYGLEYSSGGSGWTSRMHIHATGDTQRYTWKTQNGYLSTPEDPKNQEFTVYIRVHQILDPARAQISLKIRGGAHSTTDPERASCVLMTYAPQSYPRLTRFGKELTHPDYDYVALRPLFDTPMLENAWVGMKMISWNDPRDTTRVIDRLYLDTDPFDRESGRPKNTWRLFSEYVDVDRTSTGNYSQLVNWGGWQTTVRTDGFHDIDFALLSLREIAPP